MQKTQSVESISHNQLSSPSKQLYSFPKSKRFRDYRGSYCEQPYYNQPDGRDQRATGFGYGNKSDFTLTDRQKPGPNQYFARSCIDLMTQKKQGYTFALGRDQVKFGSRLPKSETPGVGAYAVKEQLNKIQFSFGVRPIEKENKAAEKIVPGPGYYESKIGISKYGQYYLSRIPSTQAPVFSPPTQSRFNDAFRKTLPGPGYYKFEKLNKSGRYFNSKLQSVTGGRWSFCPRFKGKMTSTVVPGPGSYKVYSNFPEFSTKPRTQQKQRSRPNPQDLPQSQIVINSQLSNGNAIQHSQM